MAFTLIWPELSLDVFLSLLLFTAHVVVLIRAITRPHRDPTSRIAWVAIITLVPLLGIIAYFWLGEVTIGQARMNRIRAAEARFSDATSNSPAPRAIDPNAAALFDLAHSINGLQPVAGSRFELLPDSNSAIDALVRDIAAARDHVHICFYIWLEDRNGMRVAEAVAQAARRGVACRVIADAVGSRAFIGSRHWQLMKQAGAQLTAALDDIPRLGHYAMGRIDLRNHRKIVVIDHRITYCGSQNCADPEFRIKARYAPWVDILLRCTGPIAHQQQYLFLATWVAETGMMPDLAPCPVDDEPGADGLAQIIGTGPTTRSHAMSDMFVACIYAARAELFITTPYFVPDQAILNALCAAPRRGVKTTLILPRNNDSRLVALASRSSYADLLASGITLLEYIPGLLHAKTLTIDGSISLIGSANMDRRSLDLNFENNLLIADRQTTQAIRARQQTYADQSRQVTDEEIRTQRLRTRLLQNTVGMMAPVL